MLENKPKTFEQTVIHNCEGYISNEWIDEILKSHEEELARARAEVHEQYRPLISASDAMLKNIEWWLKTGESASPEKSKKLYEDLKSALDKIKGGL